MFCYTYSSVLPSIDSFYQFVWCKYLHLGETKPLLAQVLNGCSYVIHIIVNTKEAVISNVVRVLRLRSQFATLNIRPWSIETIFWKSFNITFYLLIKTLCFNAIKCGKVTVKHNLLSSNYFY